MAIAATENIGDETSFAVTAPQSWGPFSSSSFSSYLTLNQPPHRTAPTTTPPPNQATVSMVAEAVTQAVVGSMGKLQQDLGAGVGRAVAAELNAPLRAEFVSAFEGVLVPAVEAATGDMLRQVSSSLAQVWGWGWGLGLGLG